MLINIWKNKGSLINDVLLITAFFNILLCPIFPKRPVLSKFFKGGLENIPIEIVRFLYARRRSKN
jgi:hypothetical protein